MCEHHLPAPAETEGRVGAEHCEDTARSYTCLLHKFYGVLTYHLPSTFSKTAVKWLLLVGSLREGISCKVVINTDPKAQSHTS